jgi:hypothetical protein
MAAGDGERLLNYALPVLQFLGVRRVRFPRNLLSENVPPFDQSYLEPRGELWPVPEGLWGTIFRGAARLLLGGGHGTDFILEVHQARWWVVDVKASWRPLAPEQQPCPHDRGLTSFLKGVWHESDGHLIIGDWFEDQFGPSALASAFRASQRMAPRRESDEAVAYDAFRWRWGCRDVIVYFSRRSLTSSRTARHAHVGFVLGLLYGVPGEEIPRRWGRWVADDGVARQLAAEMGAPLPEDDEPWVWL